MNLKLTRESGSRFPTSGFYVRNRPHMDPGVIPQFFSNSVSNAQRYSKKHECQTQRRFKLKFKPSKVYHIFF